MTAIVDTLLHNVRSHVSVLCDEIEKREVIIQRVAEQLRNKTQEYNQLREENDAQKARIAQLEEMLTVLSSQKTDDV
jgi:cell shape-determining protein MreC